MNSKNYFVRSPALYLRLRRDVTLCITIGRGLTARADQPVD